MIIVKTVPADPLRFNVTVREDDGETHHEVSMSSETLKKLSGDRHPPEQVIEAAFRFLLDQEPKESILGEFDITVISHYFPDFERRIGDYYR
jgi:hypothetical protein